LHISNSDFLILAGIFSAIGGIGVYEGYALNPALYSQPAIIFGGVGYFAYKTFYADRKKTTGDSLAEAKGSHSE
jgi:hypothetical protein